MSAKLCLLCIFLAIVNLLTMRANFLRDQIMIEAKSPAEMQTEFTRRTAGMFFK